MEDRAEIRSQIANSLIREGRFLHPLKGVTLFIRSTRGDGSMEGIFLHDQRIDEAPVTYTAEEALLARDDQIARLVMRNGVALTYSADDRILARVQFESFSYDLSELVQDVAVNPLDPDIQGTTTLLSPPQTYRQMDGFNFADFLAHGHERIVMTLNALILPVLALAVILTGDYQRRGFGRRIFVSISAGLILFLGGTVGKSVILANAALWPANYLPAAIAIAISLFLLITASRRRTLIPRGAE